VQRNRREDLEGGIRANVSCMPRWGEDKKRGKNGAAPLRNNAGGALGVKWRYAMSLLTEAQASGGSSWAKENAKSESGNQTR